jgi:hypothetical protein
VFVGMPMGQDQSGRRSDRARLVAVHPLEFERPFPAVFIKEVRKPTNLSRVTGQRRPSLRHR